MNIIRLTDIICGMILLLGILLYLWGIYKGKKNHNFPNRRTSTHHFAVLIPARGESKVIEGLLKSLEKQTIPIPWEDIYIIVESSQDPTVIIAKRYGASIFIRTELHLQRKGYALDEVIRDILGKKKEYDAYFILDADNILSPPFLEEMTKTYDLGYDIGIGYRNSKNGNQTVISACSTLTFSMINTMGNVHKNREGGTVTVSGTGFYIRGTWIEKWGGYPFHSFTEDYELTLYAILNEMTSFYNQNAQFYDEQPTTYQQTVIQRVRWIKGYMEARKKYMRAIRKSQLKPSKNPGSKNAESLGVIPYIILVVAVVLYLLIQLQLILFSTIKQTDLWLHSLSRICCLLLLLYLFIMTFTACMIRAEGSKLNLSKNMKRKAILFNPFFLATYVPCALKALFSKNIVWQKIEHTVEEIQSEK